MNMDRSSPIFALLCLLLMVAGCSNSLNPVDEETGVFAIYGALDLNRETNFIRIRDLNAPFTEEATREIDATVVLENLESGVQQRLESERIVAEGVFLHNFLVSGKIIPGTEYKLSVTRSDGVNELITTTTPTMPEPLAIPIGKKCDTPVDFLLEPIMGGTVTLKIGYFLGGDFPDDIRWTSERVFGPEEGKEMVSIRFTPNVILSFVVGGGVDCSSLARDKFYVSYAHYGPGFYEKIRNDPFDILQSTERFGAFYRDTLAIPIDTSRVCLQDC
jgi:hypothetical protein